MKRVHTGDTSRPRLSGGDEQVRPAVLRQAFAKIGHTRSMRLHAGPTTLSRIVRIQVIGRASAGREARMHFATIERHSARACFVVRPQSLASA